MSITPSQRFLYAASALASVLFLAFSAVPGLGEEVVVQKYVLTSSPQMHIDYIGLHHDQFMHGIPPAVGSGLEYIGTKDDGGVFLYALTNSGPIAAGPLVNSAHGLAQSTMYLAPDFAPSYGAVLIADGKAELVSLVPVKNSPGRPASGLPRAPTGLTDTLAHLPPDPKGVSPGDIAMNRNSHELLWICETQGPSLLHIGANTGRIKRRLEPGLGLPASLADCTGKAGFTGVAALPSGGVAAVTGSACGPGQNSSPGCVLAVVSPWATSVRLYRYPQKEGGRPVDLCSLSETRVLALEELPARNGKPHNRIVEVDFSAAGPLPDGNPAAIHEILDLGDYGWESKGAGLALFTDRRTLAVISDNNFGVAAAVASPAIAKDNTPVVEPSQYVLTQDNTLAYNGRPVNTSFVVRHTGENSHLWLFTFPEPIF